MKYPLISIQILNWNRALETLDAIKSAIDQSYPNIEIVVVDNGSTDNSIELISTHFTNFELVELDKNYGCPGGRNRGIPYCKGDFIFYADNDGVLHKDAVLNAFNAITSKENIGIVTAMVYDFTDRNEIDSACKIKSTRRYAFNNFQGGICLHKKSIYNKTGYYPDDFFYGAEEYYLTLKLMETEFSIVKDESVILWHKKSDIARNFTNDELNKYFNKLYTVIILFPLLPMLLFLLKFVFVYPIYAYRSRVLIPFFNRMSKDFISVIKKGVKNRDPISNYAYKRFREEKFNTQ